jgi:hypothetical protein
MLDLKRKKLKLKLAAKNKVQTDANVGIGVATKSGSLKLKSLKKKKKKKRFDGTDSGKERESSSQVSKFEVKSTRASAPVKKVAEPLPEIIKTHMDLAPWPFRREHKGIVKRENWNMLVRKIQKLGSAEAEAELEQTNQQLQQVLNERDNILEKYKALNEFVGKFTRNFQATYEVSK